MSAVQPPSAFALDQGASDTLGVRWAALGAAGEAVAALAGISPEPPASEVSDLPALLGATESWRRELAENGVADLTAVMKPGIAALLSIRSRGGDARPAAMALWHEFVAARGAILALVPAAN
jgi:hypothetical protein